MQITYFVKWLTKGAKMLLMATNVKKQFSEWLEKKFVIWQSEKGKRASLNDFADYVGYSRPLISFWLGAQRLPSEEAVKRLAELFGNEIYDALEIPRPNPYLQKISRLWEFIPEDVQVRIAEEAAQYEEENIQERVQRVPKPKASRKSS